MLNVLVKSSMVGQVSSRVMVGPTGSHLATRAEPAHAKESKNRHDPQQQKPFLVVELVKPVPNAAEQALNPIVEPGDETPVHGGVPVGVIDVGEGKPVISPSQRYVVNCTDRHETDPDLPQSPASASRNIRHDRNRHPAPKRSPRKKRKPHKSLRSLKIGQATPTGLEPATTGSIVPK